MIIDGRRYSHIINPKTGQAVEDRASVTVVAPDGGTADALETTVYILGPERGLKLVDETPGRRRDLRALDATKESRRSSRHDSRHYRPLSEPDARS